MKFALSLSGILFLLIVLVIGFWLGKNRPSLLGGVI